MRFMYRKEFEYSAYKQVMTQTHNLVYQFVNPKIINLLIGRHFIQISKHLDLIQSDLFIEYQNYK